LQREVDLLRNTFQIDQPVDVFAAAAHQFDLVDLLKHLAAELRQRAGTAQRDDRATIDQGIGHAGDQVGDARAGCGHAHRWHLFQPAIGLAHEGRRLLVAHVDHADAFLDAGGFRQQHRPAHDIEKILDPLFLQASGDDFRPGDFSHILVLPLINR
jgi:hypothetical protein